MSTAVVGKTVKSGDTLEADGDYYVSMQSRVGFTFEWTSGTGTVRIYQNGATQYALDGTNQAGYTSDFGGKSEVGDLRINLSGSSSPVIKVTISPIYSTP